MNEWERGPAAVRTNRCAHTPIRPSRDRQAGGVRAPKAERRLNSQGKLEAGVRRGVCRACIGRTAGGRRFAFHPAAAPTRQRRGSGGLAAFARRRRCFGDRGRVARRSALQRAGAPMRVHYHSGELHAVRRRSRVAGNRFRGRRFRVAMAGGAGRFGFNRFNRIAAARAAAQRRRQEELHENENRHETFGPSHRRRLKQMWGRGGKYTDFRSTPNPPSSATHDSAASSKNI
jgi:hypothetical protein